MFEQVVQKHRSELPVHLQSRFSNATLRNRQQQGQNFERLILESDFPAAPVLDTTERHEELTPGSPWFQHALET